MPTFDHIKDKKLLLNKKLLLEINKLIPFQKLLRKLDSTLESDKISRSR